MAKVKSAVTATGAPVSYKDPYWSDLATKAEEKVGIPKGLLVGILTRGEKTNADLVSSAGAKTPFQVIPSTRNGLLKNYGVDAYADDESSAVAAATLLKESLDRNKGDIPAAIAEYHGGPDKSMHGPINRAYVARVMQSPDLTAPQNMNALERQMYEFKRNLAPVPTESVAPTKFAAPPPVAVSDLQAEFGKQLAALRNKPEVKQAVAETKPAAPVENKAPNPAVVAFNNYLAGKFDDKTRKTYENDIMTGHIVLPNSESLFDSDGRYRFGSKSAEKSNMLPVYVAEAYAAGRMTPEDKAQLESEIISGKFKLPPTNGDLVPGGDNWVAPKEHITAAQLLARNNAPKAGILEKAAGLINAGGALATGMTGGVIGGLGGFLGGMAGKVTEAVRGDNFAGSSRRVEQAFNEGASRLTYEPRTEKGQEYAAAAGEALAQTIPLLPLAGLGVTAATLNGPARAAAAQAARNAARGAAARAAPVLASAAERAAAVKAGVAARAARLLNRERSPTPGTGGAGGSAGTDAARMRMENAAEMPVPPKLSLGEATRDSGNLRFEQETAKNPELGGDIRQHYSDNNQAYIRSMEHWVEDTGALEASKQGSGTVVYKALQEAKAKAKANTRAAFEKAKAAGEMEAPVPADNVVNILNQSISAESTAPVIKAVKNELIRLGGASVDEAGNLVPKTISLNNIEQLRQFTNKVTGYDGPNIVYSGEIKRAIDATTEGAGGELYKQAHLTRYIQAKKFENRAVVADILSLKRGSSDRKVAIEDVTDSIIYKGSLDDMRFARRILQTSGENGKQAWREVQGAALRDIQKEATRGTNRDFSGGEIISAAGMDKAIKRLDVDGKLDYLFGNKGAELLRNMNDLAKYTHTQPPGVVNHSNTGAIIAASLDMLVSASSGVPMPVATAARMLAKRIREQKIRARIKRNLNPSF